MVPESDVLREWFPAPYPKTPKKLGSKKYRNIMKKTRSQYFYRTGGFISSLLLLSVNVDRELYDTQTWIPSYDS